MQGGERERGEEAEGRAGGGGGSEGREESKRESMFHFEFLPDGIRNIEDNLLYD